MTLRLFITCTLMSFIHVLAFSQTKGDPVLFSVGGEDVHLSEFEYIYQKTNANNANYSRASLEEYLGLYKRFKLKVKRARDMRLDTISALKEELSGYRQQLANSYLIENEITRKLAKEAHSRMQKDVDVSHIFLMASGDDTLKAYQQALDIIKQLNKGADFAKLANSYSQDKTSATNSGRIGYITAMLPDGFYDFETAAYTLDKGKYSKRPVRSSNGYHIIKLNDERPARGKMEVAHILIRTGDKRTTAKSQMVADSIYAALQAGADFNTLAATRSEDKRTAKAGGRLGTFGINAYAPAFEEAAFGLKADGDISKPVQTRLGWHILKRIKRTGIAPIADQYPLLKVQLQRKPRHITAENRIIEKLKKDAAFTLDREVYNHFLDSIDIRFLSHRWQAPQFLKGDKTLYRLKDGTRVSLQEFAQYAQRNTRDRLRGNQRDPKQIAQKILDVHSREKVLDYAESQLEAMYPDFKALMREYEEGILLFEATKQMVWDKAADDTLGLRAYFADNRDEYIWSPRAEVSLYSLLPNDADKLKEIRDYAADHSLEEVLMRFNNSNKKVILGQSRTWEKGKEPQLNTVKFKAGVMSATNVDSNNGIRTFFKLEEVKNAEPKSLNEARGFVIADYQDYLDEEWVKSLEKKYAVKVNKKVFENLVKK